MKKIEEGDNVIEGNKLIAEFIEFNINDGFVVTDYNDEFLIDRKGTWDDVKYHSSWDWQIPVWGKIGLAVKTIIPKLEEPNEPARWYFGLVSKYEKSVFQNKPENGQKIIVELLEWYIQNKNN